MHFNLAVQNLACLDSCMSINQCKMVSGHLFKISMQMQNKLGIGESACMEGTNLCLRFLVSLWMFRHVALIVPTFDQIR